MEEQRQVAKERGKQLAMEFGMPFLETSAKTGDNVEKAFLDMTMAVLRRNPTAGASNSNRPTSAANVVVGSSMGADGSSSTSASTLSSKCC